MVLAKNAIIFIVEDDRDQAAILSDLLRKEGYEVHSVASGRKALAWTEHHTADLMLLEYFLPDMRGDQLVDRLTKRKRLLPFVVMTGSGSETIAVEMMKRGAKDYLVKGPSLTTALPAAISSILDQRHQTDPLLPREEQALRSLEEQLRQSEERYRVLVEHSPEAILVHQQGRFLFANPACLRLLGAEDPQQLFKRNALEMVHPDFRSIVDQRHRKIVEQQQVAPLMKQKMLRLDGTVVDVEVTSTPYLHEGRWVAQVMLRDIGDRLRAEDESRQHQAELAHILRLNTMGNIVSELAHEINQPLYAISNYAAASKEALQRDAHLGSSDLEPWIENILDQATRAGEIIRRLNRFVRKGSSQRIRVALDVLLRDVAALVAVDADRHQVALNLRLNAPSAVVYVDRVQIEQVAVNLLINAIEAMQQTAPDLRKLTLGCEEHENYVEVTVQDTGPGVTDEGLTRLFEAFYTTKLEGMGMGLHISRSIIEAHLGRLWARRNVGPGMTFHFTLPIAGDSTDAHREHGIHRR